MAFADKVVLVTGASSGIGAATAVLFTKKGAQVVLVGRNEQKLASVEKKCEEIGLNPLVIKADITNDEEAKTVMDKTIETFGKLDVLVNNAGAVAYGSILEGDIMEVHDNVMKINLRAHVTMTALAAPHLIQTKGNIVNVSSVTGTMVPTDPSAITYYVSKAALNHFSLCTAAEMAPHGVRVNTISPGLVSSDILRNAGLDMCPTSLDFKIPLGRHLELADVAENILHLAGSKAKCITGKNLEIDSGLKMVN